jgi:hypothetical protein|tara:strand:- start:660 stop:830 length:171 start_codon:yes stop_codon:yes gene_type:complete
MRDFIFILFYKAQAQVSRHNLQAKQPKKTQAQVTSYTKLEAWSQKVLASIEGRDFA